MPEWIGKSIGKVRIDKLLARGGMAEVYLGTHLALDRLVAVKVLQSHIEEDPGLLERFHREAKVVAGLRHSNIVQIFDFDAIDGHPYIVMEYLRGPTLATYLRILHEQDRRIPHHQIARLFRGLTAALDYAHSQGVIHRDIKPGNIMLHNKMGEVLMDQPLTDEVEVILTDFGLVRIAHSASLTATGTVSGTPSYMSPEQARGDQTDHRTDIYSLGVVLYEMLAGRVPFESDSQMSVIYMQIHKPPPPIPGIPAATQAVIDRALAKEPVDRYQSSREMAADFYRSIGMSSEGETIIEPPVHIEAKSGSKNQETYVVSKPQPVRSRRWASLGLFSIVCLLLLGIGAWGVSSFLPSRSKPTEAVSSTVVPSATLPVLANGGLPDSAGMVEVTNDTYEVGLSPADEYHMAPQRITINKFWIDKYQVTNSQYDDYLAETGAAPPSVWPGDGDHPVRGVTWDQAVDYCGSLNKRLPNEAEWEAAGRGPGTEPRLYPWGNDATAEGQALRLPDQDTYAVGTQSFNQSPFGVFDMVGNVWEWVGTPYNTEREGYKILRGGRFGLPVLDLAYRLVVAPDDTRYIQYAGFRCAAEQVR